MKLRTAYIIIYGIWGLFISLLIGWVVGAITASVLFFAGYESIMEIASMVAFLGIGAGGTIGSAMYGNRLGRQKEQQLNTKLPKRALTLTLGLLVIVFILAFVYYWSRLH